MDGANEMISRKLMLGEGERKGINGRIRRGMELER